MTKIVIATTDCFYLSPATLLRLVCEVPSAVEKWETLTDELPKDSLSEVADGFQYCVDRPGQLMSGKFVYAFNDREDAIRALPAFVRVIEEMGNAAVVDVNGHPVSPGASPLNIVEIPDDVQWHIGRGDWSGEWVAENHRTWGQN